MQPVLAFRHHRLLKSWNRNITLRPGRPGDPINPQTMRIYLLLLMALAGACVPTGQSSTNSGGNAKVLALRDQTYEPEIRTVLLSPPGNPQAPPVVALGSGILQLEFDDLRPDRDNYYARVVHCNYDWTKSDLQDLDFMHDYNEFPINNTQFSVDTHIPYVHYTFTLPVVKYPGNYVLMVYRNGNRDDLILTRRFMIFDSQIAFKRNGKLIGPSSSADLNQQLNFTIAYPDLNIQNPLTDIHVHVRQNLRWDNMASNIAPSFVRDTEKEIEYQFFDDSKMFRGGNEFRFFDLRSLNYPGRNVGRVLKAAKPYEVYLALDKSREGQPYAQYVDQDGGFIIDNYDYRDVLFANYAYVNFTLASPPVQGDVYVTGAFHYWNLNKENRMQYDSAQHQYKARLLMKQGLYDYQYLIKSNTLPAYYFEGSHYQTENQYEVFVYYRPFQPRADLLIGYISLRENPR